MAFNAKRVDFSTGFSTNLNQAEIARISKQIVIKAISLKKEFNRRKQYTITDEKANRKVLVIYEWRNADDDGQDWLIFYKMQYL